MTKKEAEELESPYLNPEAFYDPYLSRLILNLKMDQRPDLTAQMGDSDDG